MIRRLTEADRAHVVTFLSSRPQLNLYMLGNVEKLGFDNAICEFWGDVAEQSGDSAPLHAVLNRYMTGWTIFGTAAADWTALGAILDHHPAGAARLQDNPGGIVSFLPYLQRYQATHQETEEVMALDALHFQPIAAPPGLVIRRGTVADLPALIDFYANAEHMSRAPAGVERPLRDTRLWLAEAAGQIVATALTNAETKDLAMIGGVYTTPSRRGQGLSQAVCSALCADLIGAQKQPILYWGTPAAGAVYRKLGFHSTGQWRSVWLHSC